MRNLRLAFRTLSHAPIITGVAILSLALGIGANAAIFSLFNEMLLQKLPVPHPEELVALTAPGPTPGSHSNDDAGNNDWIFSYPMLRDLEAKQTPFTALGAFRGIDANLSYDNQTLNARAIMVSGGYFPALQVKPLLGRLIGPSDDVTPGAGTVVVLGYKYWKDQLGADSSVVEKTLLVDGQPFRIVGIAAKDFEGTQLGTNPSIYFPISMRSTLNPLYKGFTNRRQYWIYLFGRLKPGVTTARAQAEMNQLFKPIVNTVEVPLQTGASVATVKKFAARNIVLEDWSRGHSFSRDSRKAAVLLLFGITGVVLLIACANIANLLLARGASRSTEMAVRLSLGATRQQLLWQLLTESFVLALMGALFGLVVAKATLGLFMVLLPPDQGGALHFAIDGRVLLFAGLLTVITGFAFGLFPALHATRSDLITSIRSGVGKHSGGRAAARFRSSLVTAQIALSVALLIAAGLFVKSLRNLGAVNLGIAVDQLVTFKVSPGLNGYERPRSREIFRQVERDIRSIPGVTEVSGSLVPALGGENWDNSVSVQGFHKTPDIDDDAHFNEVGPGYFKTLNIPIIAGREFTEADAIGTTPVAIVNEAFAEKFKMGKDVVGKFMGQHLGDTLDIQIVGLVKNATYNSVRNEALPIYVTPYRQDSTIGAVNFYLRTAVDPKTIVPRVPRLIKQIDPNLPVQSLKTMDRQMRDNIFLDRMVGTLSTGFALLATLLAAIGLYGVLAYSVAQRTREIGVRMALGADVSRVRLMVLRQVGVMTAIGAVIGVAGAIAIGRWASSLLFKLSGFDATVTAIAVVGLGIVAIAAGYLPALRASRIDPTQALRYE